MINFLCGTKPVSRAAKIDSSTLPARVDNHSARFGSSCPLTQLVIYNKKSFFFLRVYFSSSARVKRARVKPESERERKSDREAGERKKIKTGPKGKS